MTMFIESEGPYDNDSSHKSDETDTLDHVRMDYARSIVRHSCNMPPILGPWVLAVYRKQDQLTPMHGVTKEQIPTLPTQLQNVLNRDPFFIDRERMAQEGMFLSSMAGVIPKEDEFRDHLCMVFQGFCNVLAENPKHTVDRELFENALEAYKNGPTILLSRRN